MKTFWGHLAASDVEAVASGRRPETALEHAATCARCAARVRRVRLRRGLLGGLKDVELSEFAFRRVERRLFTSPAPSRAGAPSWFRVALAGAALAGVVVAGRFALAPQSKTPLAITTPPALPSERAPRFASVTLQEAGDEVRRGAAWAPLSVGAQAAEGDALRTGAGRAALSLSQGTGLVLGEHAEPKLARLRDGEVLVALARGKVWCAVHPLLPGESFTVLAGPRRIDVVGTAFSVERRGDAVIVEVSHGVVALSDSGGAAGRLPLPAPIRLVAPDGRPATQLVGAQLDGPRAASLAASPAWRLAEGFAGLVARLAVTGLPGGSGVEIDGFGVGPAPVEGLFPLGEHRLRATIEGRAVDLNVTLSSEGALVGRAQFPAPPPETAGVTEALFADESELADAVKAHVPELRHCYETSLKRRAVLVGSAGSVVMTLSVGAHGKVTDVTFAGAELPGGVALCLASSAKKWKLPGTGTPIALEVPLHLTAQ